MNRKVIYDEIKEKFGFVPSVFDSVPDSTLEYEWGITKALELNETMIPGKYKHLIGIGASATIHCQYCSLFHTEMARVNGATDKEIEEAVHIAKQTAGWSTYMYGLQEDREKFRNEIRKAAEYLKKRLLKKAA